MVTQHYAINRSFASTLQLETRLGPSRPRLEVGDLLILFDKRSDDLYFTGTSAVVSATDVSQPAEETGERKTIRLIEISKINDLDHEQRLSVLSGSLEKVYRFLDPQRHFMHRIVKLSQKDYRTITEGRIYVDRSVFRQLFAALPLPLKAEFVKQHIDAFPLISNGTVDDYRRLAGLLVAFLEERVLEPLHILAVIASIHEDAIGQRLPALRNLHLTEGRDCRGNKIEPIAFGDTCQKVRDLIRSNRLFATSPVEPVLLNEALTQLNSIDFEEENTKWNDQIF